MYVGAIVTRLAAIEDMAAMSILCSDKTGTLTMNKVRFAHTYIHIHTYTYIHTHTYIHTSSLTSVCRWRSRRRLPSTRTARPSTRC